MKHVLVHVRCNAAGAIRREKLNGRDVVIVPSATMPDDVVMNSILYPAAEIAKGFKTLERTPAPLGHPNVNGKFISALDPEGLNLGYIGAFNMNVRQEQGSDGKKRVLLDKVIDVEIANQSERGKRVLAAIDKGEPVHTSTGIYCNLEAVSGDVAHKFVGRDLDFDHDAILLDEPGAATPDQGVGMMVNAQGQPEEIEVINSALADMAERDLDWAVDSLARALEQQARLPLLERIRSAAMKAFGLPERATTTNQQEDDMTAPTKEQFDALSAEVKGLSESVGKIGDTVATAIANALKPLNEQLEANAAQQKAKDEAERKELTDKVIKANVLDEAAAALVPLPALRTLAANVKTGSAAPLNGGFQANTDEGAFKLPEGEK
ncbi:hypothetical protein [Caulobacter segnis]|uniref:Uncharacterized protein n=1 Tax=Caulobacter segnis TaxID=88688 RepID=A0A2W5VB37_9CAUL|nr:hypothetical protein [Caulobacter segnis]PZR36482.1 MAG: hypothetical protein DI526_03335 [Caulobacter segnis]